MTSATSPTDARPITGEELALMPNLGPCDLVLGRIVELSPTGGEHGRIEGNFYAALRAFVRPRNLGKVLVGEVGIFTHRAPDSVRGADVVFISNARYESLRSSRKFLDVAPELVVEVLSPHDPPGELHRKLQEYLEVGVRLVWVADPDARTLTVYSSASDGRTLGETDLLTGGDVLPGFEVAVRELFED